MWRLSTYLFYFLSRDNLMGPGLYVQGLRGDTGPTCKGLVENFNLECGVS